MAFPWPWLRRQESATQLDDERAYEPPPPAPAARTYRIANTSPRPLALFLEPWGSAYRIEPGDFAELLVEGPPDHPLDWEFGQGTLIISSRAEAGMLTLWRDGAEIPAA
ncbi:MAG TPA: hypothetical protein VF665_12210 [Longimicrobium sp.]|uniref:hypothetical protein n=1 Tax=Longimicrobium sp. TaxID=2029185 RepID=UPI002ED8FF69